MINTRDIAVRWVIKKLNLPIPSVSGSFRYDGEEKHPTISEYDSRYIRISNTSGTNVGTYTSVASLIDKTNTNWEDSTTEDKSYEWTISTAGVEIPSLLEQTFIYTGDVITPEATEYDTDLVRMDGDTSATNVGNYTIRFRLADRLNTEWSNTEWTDGTIDDKVVNWSITKLSLDVPTVSNTSFIYNRFEQSPTVSEYDTNFIRVMGDRATAAGDYVLRITLIDPNNTQWSDGTTADKTFNWSIQAITVQIPTVSSNLTYNGNPQSPTISEYDSTQISVSGNEETNAGNYNVTFVLTDPQGYVWSDGTNDPQTAAWSIARIKYDVPSLVNNSFTYDESQSVYEVEFEEYDTNAITCAGQTTANGAGTYNINCSLVDTVNTCWQDDTTADKTISWTVAKKQYTIPTVISESPTYDGNSHSPTFSEYSTSAISVSGTQIATDTGYYMVTFTLNDTDNTCWEDGTTVGKQVYWNIEPILVEVPTVTNTSFTYDGTDKEPTITNMDEDLIDVSGNVAVNAGDYMLIFSLKDVVNHAWQDDGTSIDRIIEWTIHQLKVTIPSITSSPV